MSPIVTHINYYLPKKNYSNDKLKNNKSIDSIIKKVGINKKFSAEDNEYASDLAIKAVKKLIDDFPDLRKSIDFLISSKIKEQELRDLLVTKGIKGVFKANPSNEGLRGFEI